MLATTYLSALFQSVTGSPRFVDGDGMPLDSLPETPQENVLVRAGTDTGAYAVVVRFFTTFEDAQTAFADGMPSVVLQKQGTECFVAVWKVDAELPDERAAVQALCDLWHDEGTAAGHVSVPVPGYFGWDYASEASAQAVLSGAVPRLDPAELLVCAQAAAEQAPSADKIMALKTAPAEADEAVSSSASDALVPTEVKGGGSIEIFGTLDTSDLQFDRLINLGASSRPDDKLWSNKELTIGELLRDVTRHAVGPKIGSSFLQGALAAAIGDKVQRKARAMREMHWVGLDVDCGWDIDEISRKVLNLGFMCVLYTTHSHMGTTTDILQDELAKFAWQNGLDMSAIDTVRRRQIEVRGYMPRIAATFRNMRTAHLPKGITVTVDHEPMPKFRLVFPMAAPFVFMDTGLTQQASIDLWKRKIHGMGKLIGVPIDESCVDPSHLFYLPRHDKGRPFLTRVFAGSFITFDQIPEAEKKGRGLRNPLAEAAAFGAAREVKSPILTPSGMNLGKWAMIRGKRFEIASALLDHAPSGVVVEDNGAKITVTCPFDGEHGNAGDTGDKGCFAQNASSEQAGDGGFVFLCRHNSCSDRHSTTMLCEAIRHGWIPEDALFDAEYLCGVDEDEEPEAEATVPEAVPETRQVAGNGLKPSTGTRERGRRDPPARERPSKAIDSFDAIEIARRRAEGFDEETSAHLVEATLREYAKAGALDIQVEKLIAMIARNTGINKTTLNKTYARIRRTVRADRTNEEKAESIQRGTRDNTVGIALDQIDDYEAIELATAALLAHNELHPRLFRFSGGNVRAFPAGDAVEITPLSAKVVTNALKQCVTFVKTDPATGICKGIVAPRFIAEDIEVDANHVLPLLEGFTRMPFLSPTGEIVTRIGYDHGSGYMLTLPHGFTPPTFPDDPTDAQIAAAREAVLEPFRDFPFDDGEYGEAGVSSLAHVVAMIVTHFVRPAINGPVPAFAVMKPAAGTGGTLLVEAALGIATGTTPSSATDTTSEEERRKAITAIMMAGRATYWLDNIRHRVDSAALANLVTGRVWEDRRLGASQMVAMPNRTILVLTGNNLTFSHEIARRVVPIRIDAKDDPLKRKTFKIGSLKDFVFNNRERLAAAVLTIVRAWVARGSKRWSGKAVSSFEVWSGVVGGILESAGLAGFLDNLALVQSADEEQDAWTQLVTSWYARPDWDQPNACGDPLQDDTSLAAIFTTDASPPAIPGVRARTEYQTAINLRAALKSKKDNIFELADGGNGNSVKLAIRVERLKGKGAPGFRLEIVE